MGKQNVTEKKAPVPLIIGLTGNIATGKSTVLAWLAAQGAHVIDADTLAHKTIEPDGLVYPNVVREFGADILHPDGTVNRSALGRIVFADPAALQKLEEIIHPAVFELARTEIAQTKAKVEAKVIVIEAIKLLESGRMVTLCHEVWVVTASAETQLHRLLNERRMDEAEARRRMAAQSSQEEKVRQANRVIRNDTTLADLYAQLEAIWEELQIAYPTMRRQE